MSTNNQEKDQNEMDFEKIWKEMDAIEPLTPFVNGKSELPGTSPDIHSSTT